MKKIVILSALFFVSFLIKGQIIISEVADPADESSGKFVELFNAGTSDVDFDTDVYFFVRQVNGGTTFNEVQLTGLFTAGETYVIANDSTNFFNLYGFYPNITISGNGGNGDDTYYLYSGADHLTGTLVDIYGEPDLDGTGTAWDYTDSKAQRNFDIVLPNTTWTASEWTISGANYLETTPGMHSPPLVAKKLSVVAVNSGNPVLENYPFEISFQTLDSLGNPTETDIDINISIALNTGSGSLTGVTSGIINANSSGNIVYGLEYSMAETGVSLIVSDNSGVLEADTSDLFDVISAPPLVNLVITEIMYNPPETGTDSLEYIEIYNNDVNPVSLLNFSLSEGLSFDFGDTTINPGEYIVVAERASAMQTMFGFSPFVWSGGLSNSGEAIVLLDNYARIVDSVFYENNTPWPVDANGNGASLEFCDPSMDNSLPDGWSASLFFVDTINGGFPVYGTPGSSCSFPEATAVNITSINGGTLPLVNNAFTIDVELIDDLNSPAVSSTGDVGLTLTLYTGNGSLSGTLNGTIAMGSSSYSFTDISYDLVETGVSVIVETDDLQIEADTSEFFEVIVIPNPSDIMVSNFNGGVDPVVNDNFYFEVSLVDDLENVVNALSDVPLTINLASGTGNLSGTLKDTIYAGSSTVVFENLTYNLAETGVEIAIEDDQTGSMQDTVYFSVNEQNNQLLISEIIDPADDFNLRFIELFNAGSTDISFDNDIYYVSRQVNGGTTWEEVQLSGIIQSGEAYVIANNTADFTSFYGFSNDAEIGGSGGNGDDAYFLYKGGDHQSGTLIDIYGELDINGSGTDWDYLDSRARRNYDVVNPNTTWTQSEWTITGADAIDGTPGSHTPPLEPKKISVVSVNYGNDVLANYPFDLEIQLLDSLGNITL
ncbi:MAG: hypothetical protein C0594_11460, partial [Marinilabiliales bacterium]